MGKTVTAADLLKAGRRHPPRSELPEKDRSVTSGLENETSDQLDVQTPRRLGDQSVSGLVAQTSRRQDLQTSNRADDQTSSRSGAQTTGRSRAQASRPLVDSSPNFERESPGQTTRLDDQATSPPGAQTSELPDAQTPSGLGGSTSSRLADSSSGARESAASIQRLDDSSPGPLGTQTPTHLGPAARQFRDHEPPIPSAQTSRRSVDQHAWPATENVAPTYQRVTVFFTPEQRLWLKVTAKQLPVDGLSASDIVRLALNRLRADVDEGYELVEALTNQAHAEAARLVGRRNRGLPPRAVGEESDHLSRLPRRE